MSKSTNNEAPVADIATTKSQLLSLGKFIESIHEPVLTT